MSLEINNAKSAEWIGTAFARHTLDGWERMFAELPEDNDGASLMPLLEAQAGLYGLEADYREQPRDFWPRFRPVLVAEAVEIVQPPPTADQEAAISQARTVTKGRPLPPQVQSLDDGVNGLRFLPDHTDADGWAYHLCEAFGTRSLNLVNLFVDELKALVKYDQRPTVQMVNAALAIIRGCDPKTEMQAAMCAQAVALHWATMKLGANVLRLSFPNAKDVIALTKLSTAFDGKVETLAKLQGRLRTRKAVFKVERHDHRHQHLHHHEHREGGPIINGKSNAGTRAGHGGKIRRLESASAGACPEVWSEDAARNIVPGPGCEGQEAVPASRRGARARSAEG